MKQNESESSPVEVVASAPVPAQKFRVPFFRPSVSDDEIKGVVAAMTSGWLTSGPQVKEFEARFAEAVGAKHAVAVNSATAALHLCLEAIGVGSGDEVLVPTLTFAATAEVVVLLGATPVLVDCDPDTLSLDVADARRKLTPRTRAIMPVHYAGQPCDVDGVMALAAEAGIKVIEDAAHAFPAHYGGRKIGSIGTATCFSFYANKTLTTGEGGMVTTDDQALAARVRLMSLHGLSRNAWNRFAEPRSWDYAILAAGYKYNMTDVAAAMGLAQLRRSEAMLAARQACAERYLSAFAAVPEIRPVQPTAGNGHAWHLFVVRFDFASLTINRDQLVGLLDEAGIGVSVHYRPLHMHPYYVEKYGFAAEDFPNAQQAFGEMLSLPLFSSMTEAEQEHVVTQLTTIIVGHRKQ